MIARCEDVYLFADGELEALSAECFRYHLAECPRCQVELDNLIQLQLLEYNAASAAERAGLPPTQVRGPENPVERPAVPATAAAAPSFRPRRRWARLALLAATALAAAAALLVFPMSAGKARTEGLVASLVTRRTLEARLTHPGADLYRESGILLGTSEAEPLPNKALGELEEAKDFRGLAAIYLLCNYPEQAERALEGKSGPDVESDRAVVDLALARRDRSDGRWRKLEEALIRIDGVLDGRPLHPQALWNRGLVLRELGLSLLAADAFDKVAQLGEHGWADEARRNAESLRRQVESPRKAWHMSSGLGRHLVELKDDALPLAAAKAHPGVMRLWFYDAVRSAPSAGQVLLLKRLAAVLDEYYGGAILQDYLDAVSHRDFNRRAPLAQTYAQLALDRLPAAAYPDFLERLRQSDEVDLLVGALVRMTSMPRLPSELEALLRSREAAQDPWIQLVLVQERAREEKAHGRWREAGKRLRSALEGCSQTKLVYRCALLEKELTDLSLNLHLPNEAHQHAWSGWKLSRGVNEWKLEQSFLQQLAQVARYRRGSALAHAYLEESLLREPHDCDQQWYGYQNLAAVDLDQGFKVEEARRDLLRALHPARSANGEACKEKPLGMTGALVLAELVRSGGMPEDDRQLALALEGIRAAPRTPGEVALADHAEGRFRLERDPVEGERLLRRAIREAEEYPSDVNARKARAYSYTSLILAAGKVGASGEALRLLAEQMETSVPQSCAVAVTLEEERMLSIVLGHRGELLSRYEPHLKNPLSADASGLLAPDMRPALAGCEHVDVLAQPPVHGRARLLPPEVAWSYRVGRAHPPSQPPASGWHLVVADVEPPAGLERLQAWRPDGPDPLRRELLGPQATPRRVLKEMRDATELEIHAHGLINLEVSDASLLALTPDPGEDGRYALTAADVRQQRLEGAPLVVLAACEAAHTAPFLHEPFSLPAAFIQAGARAVLAATVKMPDVEATAFFDEVRKHIREGQPPAVAVRDARMAWLKGRSPAGNGVSWVEDVLVFE